jgi:two-component system, sensor histidine kinase and response regulator
VVLMDLQMPVMDGYEATRLLRADARFVNLPIVALSAHAMADERERCQVLGMNGHLSKPIDPETLYAVLAGFNAPGAAVRPGPSTAPALRPASAAAADPIVLPQVPGLDLHVGLHHADGKRALYARLLRGFADDYADFRARFDVLLAAEQWRDATRQAHTLKGLAGSLGARAVAAQAASLEAATRAQERVESRERLASTCKRLEPLLSALREHFATALDLGSTSDGDRSGATSLPGWFARLRELLQQSDVEAKDLWESRRSEVANRLPFEAAQRITLALDRFEFDLALRLLDENVPQAVASHAEAGES